MVVWDRRSLQPFAKKGQKTVTENKIRNLEKVPLDLGLDSEQAKDTEEVRPLALTPKPRKPTANAARVARVAKTARKASGDLSVAEDGLPVPPVTDVTERVSHEDGRRGSEGLQKLADEVRRYELPTKYKDKPHQKTLLHIKQQNEEKDAYKNIRSGLKAVIGMLNNELGDLKDKAELTKEEKTKCQRELLKHAKLLVRRLEKDNHLHIFIFKSATGNWWKMGGNSIAIHSLMVATYLDREIKVNADRDLFGQFREGVICLQDEQRLQKDIHYSGAPLTLDKTINFGPFQDVIRAYRLRVALTDNELRRFHKLDAEVLKNIRNNIFTAAPEVELNNYIVAALRESYHLERHLDSSSRPAISHPLMDSMFKVRRAYYDVANRSRRDPARWQALERVDLHIGDAMSVLANYADLGIANRNTIARVSLGLAKARELTRQKLNTHYHQHDVVEKLKDSNEVDG